MKKSPSPMRVIAVEAKEDNAPHVQLSLENRSPIANRDQGVLIWIMILGALSFFAAGIIYRVPGIERLHLIGDLHGGARLSSMAAPIFLAMGYWLFYSDHGPGFSQDGYVYKEITGEAHVALNSHEGQRILAEAIKDIPTMEDGARYLPHQQATELNRRIKNLMDAQAKEIKKHVEEAFTTAIIAAGLSE